MFSPYHRFSNCTKLEKWILDNYENGQISENVKLGYNRYHFSLLHKLKSANYHLENLENVLIETDATEMLSNSEVFLQQINMHLDGFFYCCGSALDILAREVLVYFNIPLPRLVYFKTAKEKIESVNPSDTILNKLRDPTWKEDFSMYRNALTHELLIAGNYNINVNIQGVDQLMTVVFSLPDDPRVDINDRSFRKNPNGIEYCKITFQRIISLINQIYGEIEQRAKSNGSLPI
ncbi:MAG: hypothetical protein APR54_08690 [Candidatus Cloacimonas sp. SDB]|nr:MAG: hypothetical protein APR54_08690 [Candidatus Cloacimonas sp. SDB]